MTNWFYKQKIVTMVQVRLFLIGLMTITIFSVTMWQTQSIKELTDRVAKLRVPTAQSSLMMLNGMNHSLSALSGWMILGQEQFKIERLHAWNDEILPSLQEMEKLSANWTNSENIQKLKEIKQALNNFKKYQDEIEKIAPTIDNLPAKKILLADAVPGSFSIKEKLYEMIEDQNNLLKIDTAASTKKSDNLVLTLWIMLFVVIGMMIIFANVIMTAIKKPLQELDAAVKSSEQTQWIQAGIKSLNTEVIGLNSLSEVSKKSLNVIANYLCAGTASLYHFNKESQELHSVADFASVKKEKARDTFLLGEGTIGQVALQETPIYLEGRQDLIIETSHTRAEALYSYTFPLLDQNELFGVIEFGSNTSFDKKIFEFLNIANSIVAKALRTAEQSENVNKLLVQAEHNNMALSQQKDALDSHSIVGITDVKGTITYANSKFSEISGYSNEELVGANHRIVNSGTYDESFWKEMYSTISSGQVWHCPAIKNKCKDGTPYWVDTTIFPFMNAQGKPESYIAIRTDVTRNIKIENELMKAKEEAELAVVAKADFLASMSHEIRTPMNGVIGMLGLLSREDMSKRQAEHVAIATASATSLLSVINDVLDFSKIEAGKIELETIEFDVKNEIENFSKSIAITVKNSDVELLLDLSGITHPVILSDVGRLKQILNNLVGNAIKFTHEGNIIIKAVMEDTQEMKTKLTISVEDSGIGVSEDKLKTLFDAFTQADSSTTRKYGGTGLGLSIAKNLVELLGGELSVESELGKGSIFSFYIEVEYSNNQPLNMPITDIRGKRALIVDDNKINIDILKRQLELWDIEVTVAMSAKETLEICNQRSEKEFFDFVVLDMQVSDMNGEALGEKLSAMPKAKDMKMIMMTSYGEHENIDKLQVKGFHAFFMKPTAVSDLYDALLVLTDRDDVVFKDEKILTKSKLNALLPVEIEKSKNVKILLVEDNQTNQLVAQGMLETLGLEADIANNGQEAIDILNTSTTHYDVILMDCQMPILDGFAATKAIRDKQCGDIYSKTYIIAMTANAMEGDKEKCLAVGMDDYVSKPFVHEVFKEVLFKGIHLLK